MPGPITPLPAWLSSLHRRLSHEAGVPMHQVAVHGANDIRLDEAAPIDPGPRDAVVTIAACGICGSDLTYIKTGGFCITGGPMPLGHEMAGIVDWVGPEVTDASVGDRVVVHPGDPATDGLNIIGNGGGEGGLTERLVVRDAARGGRLVRVPDELPLDVAALSEPVGVGMRSAEMTDAQQGDRVAVFGCGPIGLAAIASLADRGIEAVGVDISDRRLDLAGQLGAAAVLNPSTDDAWDGLIGLHGRDDYMGIPVPATDAYIEATGSGTVLNDIVERSASHSRLSVVAVHMEPVLTNFLMVMSKQLVIKGSMGYPARFEDSVDLLCRRDLSGMITDRVALDRFPDALAILEGSRECGKVLVTTGQGS